MIGHGHPRRENKATRADSAALGLIAHILHGQRAVLQKPEHTAGNRIEYAHPVVEDRGGDLVTTIETTIDESRLGQSHIATRPRHTRGARRIVHLIATRQVNYLLGIVPARVLRYDGP